MARGRAAAPSGFSIGSDVVVQQSPSRRPRTSSSCSGVLVATVRQRAGAAGCSRCGRTSARAVRQMETWPWSRSSWRTRSCSSRHGGGCCFGERRRVGILIVLGLRLRPHWPESPWSGRGDRRLSPPTFVLLRGAARHLRQLAMLLVGGLVDFTRSRTQGVAETTVTQRQRPKVCARRGSERDNTPPWRLALDDDGQQDRSARRGACGRACRRREGCRCHWVACARGRCS